MSPNMLGGLNEQTAFRLEGAFTDFAEKLNSAKGSAWEEAFKRMLRKELLWPCPVCNPFRETEELSIEIPALPRPTFTELQAKYNWIEKIESDDTPEGPVTLTLGTLLRFGEDAISGEEYERRLPNVPKPCLGFQHCEWLIAHQAEFPEFMALLEKVYIDFPGLVVVDGDGDRRVSYALKLYGRWRSRWPWLARKARSDGRVAVAK